MLYAIQGSRLLSTTEIGREGERKAREMLESKGHVILETNWRYRRYEIDIISRSGGQIVFTEVKQRFTDEYGQPEVAVNRKKQRRMIEAANFYLLDRDIDLDARFDVVSIVGEAITHMEHAFHPFAGG